MNLDKLRNLNSPPPPGYAPGIEWDGTTGHITMVTKGEEPERDKINGVLDSSPFLNGGDIEVDWTARPRVSLHHNDMGELVQAWYKFALRKRIDRSFDIEELVERINDPYFVETQTSTWRTILITDQHIGKSGDAGGGTEQIVQRWLDSVGNALDGTFEGINLAFGGDIIEGVVSQGGRNITQMDMTLTEQIRVAQHLVSKTIQLCLEHAPQVIVSVAPGNHGETTRVQNTGMGDSHDIQIVSSVQQAFELAGIDRVTFYYPETPRAEVVYQAGGTTFCLVHGHTFKGQMAGAQKWWEGQTINARPAGAASILMAGHFHNFQAANIARDRWVLFGPSLETESVWFANQTGGSAMNGVLMFDVVNDRPVNMAVV